MSDIKQSNNWLNDNLKEQSNVARYQESDSKLDEPQLSAPDEVDDGALRCECSHCHNMVFFEDLDAHEQQCEQ